MLGIMEHLDALGDRLERALETPVELTMHSREMGRLVREVMIIALGEADIETKTPGTLSVGDWDMRCWIVGGEPTEYWLDDRISEFVLKILTDDPVWTKTTSLSFSPLSPEDQKKISGLDYPHDFSYDYVSDILTQVVFNGSPGKADFLWRAHGPIVNPEIKVGDNLYKVYVTIPDRAYLEIDSREKTIILVDADVRKNFYAYREKGAPGSGTYIFEKLPTGKTSVTWNRKFGFDLVVYETRSTPPYEE
ncbi:unnamed protein product [Cylicostephanus goldi]|uniref:Uncharacterized protein n=1 Tax=Cylicostephanus goldi TaxID=71465 RepID=A0A3P7PWT0_CYLGO|nr:unnamed protein product [Cylicostephanus goldi]